MIVAPLKIPEKTFVLRHTKAVCSDSQILWGQDESLP
uniref:Uncharacterized protein n=1 Tax=Anguilla anguilla TaxID=7936 RepID=A0A0E9PJS6_ANGAN